MKRLIVYLNGERVGTLDEDDSGLLEFASGPLWRRWTSATFSMAWSSMS
jgi:hypothetical protein